MRGAAATTVLVDGVACDSIPWADRGLHYGDGLFETVRVRGGAMMLWDRHKARLNEGCRRLGMACPDLESLTRELAGAVAHLSSAVAKIIVTRGAGGRGYHPPIPSTPTRLIAIYPWRPYPRKYSREGIELRVCATRLGLNPALAGLKHLNRLEQVLARSEWDDPAIAEGLMLDVDGRVVEGTMSNLFLVRDGRILTPDLGRCGVAGVMRAETLAVAARMGLVAEVCDVWPDDLAHADELWVCNSVIGMWPVRRLARSTYGRGPLYRRFCAEIGLD